MKKILIYILVGLSVAWGLSEILKFTINIPHIKIILTIVGIILPIVYSSTNKKKSTIITIITAVTVLFYAVPAYYSVNKSKSIHEASFSSQASSKIVQSSSQTQISSQTGNNNAKVVINNGQNGEVNGNNFYGPGQAVQTNSTKNVQINSNNFYQ